MKKRILTLVMVLVLMIAVSVMGVSADDAAPQAVTPGQTWSNLTVADDGLTAEGYCPHCCRDDLTKTVTWYKFVETTANGNTTMGESKHYFLADSFDTTKAINPSVENVDVVLHLNGKTFKRKGANNKTGVICPANTVTTTTFSIVDNEKEEGTIDGDYGWAVYANGKTGTTVNLYSGNLTSKVTTIATAGTNTNGGTVYMNAGDFNMYGGTINGTKATNGGAIYVSGGAQVTISGGTIQGGQASSGGNIYMASTTCELNITNGTISGGKAAYGGNIYTNNGLFELTGGIISGGQATYGGNIYTNTGTDTAGENTTTVDGAAQIKGGKATYGGNLYINRKFTLGAVTFEKGTATYGSDIYVHSSGRMTVDAAFAGEAGVYYHMGHLTDTVLGGIIRGDTQKENDGEYDPKNPDEKADDINRCGDFTGALYLENEEGAPLLYPVSGTGDDLLHIANVALIGNDGSYTWYTSHDQAVSAYNADTKYMQIGGDVTLTGGNYVVDLAGNDVTITGSGSVKIFDSANADYKTYGTATVDGPTVLNNFKEIVNGAVTYKVQSGNQFSFHRLGMEIVTLGVGSDDAGMYYEGVWHCDDALAEQVQSYGVAVALNSMPGSNFKENPNTYTEFTSGFTPGVPFKGVRIREIMKADATNNADRSNRQIYAAPYVTFTDDTTVMSTRSTHYSLCDALETVENNLYNYWTQEETLKGFYDTWKDRAGWEYDFNVSEDEEALLTAYSGRTAYHGEAHDHSASGGNSDGTYTLNQWKKSLKEKNMDFTTILDHKQWSHMTNPDWDSSLFIGGSEASTELAGGNYDALKDAGKSVQMHYSMIFPGTTADSVLDSVRRESALEGYRYGILPDYYDLFNYPSLSVKDENANNTNNVLNVINAVKAAGGMFVHVHPKASPYLDSENIEDYYFADWTGLEVHYGVGGYAPKQKVSKDNYDLWTDLLKAGKKIWATAGTDLHEGASTNALTTVYSNSADATDIFSYMKVGNTTCGPVGIRMSINGALMGSQVETAFTAGQKVIFSVGDFHESAYNSTHTYTAKLYKGVGDNEELVGEPYTIENPQKGFIASVDVDPAAAYYRVEVWDSSVSNLPIAIGNPIWNK